MTVGRERGLPDAKPDVETVGLERGLTDAEPDVETEAEIVEAKEPNTLQSVGIEGLPAQV